MSHFRSPESGRREKRNFYSLLGLVYMVFPSLIYPTIIFVTSTLRTVPQTIQGNGNASFLLSFETKERGETNISGESIVQSAAFHMFPHLTVTATPWGRYYLYSTEVKTENSAVKLVFQGHTSKRAWTQEFKQGLPYFKASFVPRFLKKTELDEEKTWVSLLIFYCWLQQSANFLSISQSLKALPTPNSVIK